MAETIIEEVQAPAIEVEVAEPVAEPVVEVQEEVIVPEAKPTKVSKKEEVVAEPTQEELTQKKESLTNELKVVEGKLIELTQKYELVYNRQEKLVEQGQSQYNSLVRSLIKQ
tara:strand:- start:785 stop:1120 length:336 start_codon:yes stop_codon:yes gene_type:complete